MTYIYTLRTPDGDDVGEVDLREPVSAGAEIRGAGIAGCAFRLFLRTDCRWRVR